VIHSHESRPILQEKLMFRKSLFLAPAILLATLVTSSTAQAWGGFHVGYTHVGYGGVYHAGYTHVGGYGGYDRYGGMYRGGYGGMYGGYHYGYGGAYGGYHYGYGAYPYGGYAGGRVGYYYP
jgi:hypothetical protein